LFTFYFLLNEEVRKYIKDRKKKLRLKAKEKNLSSNLKNIQDLMIRNEERLEDDEDEDEGDDQSQLFKSNNEFGYLNQNDNLNTNEGVDYFDDFSFTNVSIGFINLFRKIIFFAYNLCFLGHIFFVDFFFNFKFFEF
jgi:hypothetical protein